jgi:hypothetical protein
MAVAARSNFANIVPFPRSRRFHAAAGPDEGGRAAGNAALLAVAALIVVAGFSSSTASPASRGMSTAISRNTGPVIVSRRRIDGPRVSGAAGKRCAKSEARHA